VGISINHERLSPQDAEKAKGKYRKRFNVPVEDPVAEGVEQIVDAIEKLRDG
jgi:uncharacterized NAD-dependent epimerase/dehydratase family protein